MALLDRDDQLATIAAAARRTRDGAGRLVLVRGQPGSGKTSLLAEAGRRAEATGMRVLRIACREPDGPDAALDRLLPGAPGAAADEHALFHQRYRWLHQLAADSPLLLAVDDVDLADDAFQRWLTFLARRLDRVPVLVVVTERLLFRYSGAPVDRELTHRLPGSLATLVDLGPLGADAGVALVRARFGAAVPEEVARECARASLGVPMLLHALLDDLAAVGEGWPEVLAGGAEWFPRGRYGAAIRTLVSLAAWDARQVGRALGVLDGEEATEALLPAVSGVDGPWLRAVLQQLRHQGSVVGTPPRLAHPLLRDAVLSGVEPAERQAAHRAAAKLLYERGAPAEAVARHLLRTPGPTEPWAVDSLLCVADGAIGEGRTDLALRLLRHVADSPLPSPALAEVLSRLGALEALSDPLAGARRLGEALRLQPDEGRRAAIAPALGMALAAGGEVAGAVAALDEIAEGLADVELAEGVRAVAVLAAAPDDAVWVARLEQLRAVTDGMSPESLPHAIVTLYEAGAGRISAAELAARVRHVLAGRWPAPLDPCLRALAGSALCWADRTEEGHRLIDEVAEGMAPFAPQFATHVAGQRADTAVVAGRYERALAAGRDPRVASTPYPAAQVVLALVELDRLDEARRLADDVTARAPRMSWEWNFFLFARGYLHAALGDPDRALADYLECGERQLARRFPGPMLMPWRVEAALTHAELGRPADAARLAEEDLALARTWGTERAVGRALRARGVALGGEDGERALAEAVAALARSPAEPDLVRALVDLGRARVALGRGRAGREVLHEALARAERLGAPRLTRLARTALAAAGARLRGAARSGPGALTAAERRVVRLAADGHSNPEICAALHLTRRTVETHLTNAYRKLGITRRAQLAEVLADE
ncbi:AAA family ATPase [Streptoalloteichus hindustanus]|uniref:AAA family ATPase n=1 Tax=Streptoalloteichus hindustanus TaxID=2017 RepID=UPI00135672A7|nr:AAA family ATPase [Streptoalloteichus hindustanus]